MKGLNKLALATAVAAAPFATQAMEPMSESEMGNTTGQAGVTIELDTQLGIDQIQYDQGQDTGSVLVNNLSIEGIDTDAAAGYGEGLDLKVNVDLPSGNADGDSLSDFGSKSGQRSSLGIDNDGEVVEDGGDAIGKLGGGEDLTLNNGDALISLQSYNVDANDDSLPVDMKVKIGDGDAADDQNNGNAFQLDGDAGTATLVSDIEMDLFLSQADIIARTDNRVGGDDASGSLEIEAGFAIDNLNAEFDVASVGIEGMRMAGFGSLNTTLKGDTQGDGSVLGAGAAIVSMDIGQGDSLSATGPSEALRVNLDNFQADIWMPTINVGNADNASIGRVGISNLQVSNTEMAIYGRE